MSSGMEWRWTKWLKMVAARTRTVNVLTVTVIHVIVRQKNQARADVANSFEWKKRQFSLSFFCVCKVARYIEATYKAESPDL